MMTSAGLLLLFILAITAMQAEADTTQWYAYEEGILASSTLEKPVFIEFYADWCPPCIAMEENTYPDPRVISELKDFIAIKVDTQKRIDIETKYGIAYYPTIVFLDPKGREVARHVGYLGPEEMVEVIKQSRGKLPRESPGFAASYLVLTVAAAIFWRRFIG